MIAGICIVVDVLVLVEALGGFRFADDKSAETEDSSLFLLIGDTNASVPWIIFKVINDRMPNIIQSVVPVVDTDDNLTVMMT